VRALGRVGARRPRRLLTSWRGAPCGAATASATAWSRARAVAASQGREWVASGCGGGGVVAAVARAAGRCRSRAGVTRTFQPSVALRRCAVSGTSVEGAAAAGVTRQLSMQCVAMVAALPYRPSLRGNQLPLRFRSKAWTAAQNTA